MAGNKNEIWRRIITNHMGLLDLFASGNEGMLQRARQNHPELNRAIETNGMPSQELLHEMQFGVQSSSSSSSSSSALWSFAATMPYREDLRLSEQQLHEFFADGYLKIESAVPLELIALAKRHINVCIGKGEVEHKFGLVGLKDHLAQSEAILNLFKGPGSKLPTLVQNLMGRGKCRPPTHAQVALRYPTPYLGPEADSRQSTVGGRSWHVDGFDKGNHSSFTLLLGVCLSDVDAKGSGNFAVHPGAHWTLQEEVRRHVASGSGYFSEFQEHANKPDLGEPVQLLMKAGDCVLAHQKLPHLGTPNCSPDIRYQVYFRLHHVAQEDGTFKEMWLDDLLLPFEPVRAVVSGGSP